MGGSSLGKYIVITFASHKIPHHKAYLDEVCGLVARNSDRRA
jgi:hypothetical protein